MKLLNKSFKAAKRGVTLSELCVVIALVAVVSVAVVSFTTIAGAITKSSAAKEKAAERIDFVEDLLEGWVDSAIANNATELIAQNDKLVAKIEDKQYTFSFADGKVTASFSEDNKVDFAVEEITKIKFEEMRNDSDVIFFCTVTYVYENSREVEIEKGRTFCVNTRLDDVV